MEEIVSPDPLESFLRAATWHGTLDGAEAILSAHPEIATAAFTRKVAPYPSGYAEVDKLFKMHNS